MKFCVGVCRCRNAPRVGKCAVVIGEGEMIPASQICDNPAHPGTIPIDETLAQELQFQADTANNVLLNLPSAVRKASEIKSCVLQQLVCCL